MLYINDLCKMSSFTNHTEIYPSNNIWERVNAKWFRYYIWDEWWDEYVDIPEWYIFDWASVPMILGMFIQKVETDTITSACLHDYLYTDHRKYWRIKSDIIFYESLVVYNIPKILKQKKYIIAFLCTIKYIIMTIWLLLFSWFVWYKISNKILCFIKKQKT